MLRRSSTTKGFALDEFELDFARLDVGFVQPDQHFIAEAGIAGGVGDDRRIEQLYAHPFVAVIDRGDEAMEGVSHSARQ